VLHIRVVLRDSARRPGVRTEFFSLFFSPWRQMYVKSLLFHRASFNNRHKVRLMHLI
jgi:hypothetical protein